ncbi:MAG TPA: hypothetical protein VGR28_03835 [Candidatus Thermoplasmatota archaeon]|jgi:hypothetical protein|nr:hypothetical protein [Candidatus Thermoplasmatota archaeon]
MRAAVLALAAVLVAAACPARADAPGEAWLLAQALAHGWPDTPELRAKVQAAAAQLARADLAAMAGGAPRAVPPGIHVGETWWECLALFTEPDCVMTNDEPSGLFTCLSVPAHWALFVWAGNSLRATLGEGFLLTWTEAHLGLGPLYHTTTGGTFVGSLCLTDYGFAKIAQGNGVFMET